MSDAAEPYADLHRGRLDEALCEVPTGEPGEICVRGAGAMGNGGIFQPA